MLSRVRLAYYLGVNLGRLRKRSRSTTRRHSKTPSPSWPDGVRTWSARIRTSVRHRSRRRSPTRNVEAVSHLLTLAATVRQRRSRPGSRRGERAPPPRRPARREAEGGGRGGYSGEHQRAKGVNGARKIAPRVPISRYRCSLKPAEQCSALRFTGSLAGKKLRCSSWERRPDSTRRSGNYSTRWVRGLGFLAKPSPMSGASNSPGHSSRYWRRWRAWGL